MSKIFKKYLGSSFLLFKQSVWVHTLIIIGLSSCVKNNEIPFKEVDEAKLKALDFKLDILIPGTGKENGANENSANPKEGIYLVGEQYRLEPLHYENEFGELVEVNPDWKLENSSDIDVAQIVDGEKVIIGRAAETFNYVQGLKNGTTELVGTYKISFKETIDGTVQTKEIDGTVRKKLEFKSPCSEAKLQILSNFKTLEVATQRKIETKFINLFCEEEKLSMIWTSSDPSVIRVSQEGEVNALKEGTATITVHEDGHDLSESITIEVTQDAATFEPTLTINRKTNNLATSEEFTAQTDYRNDKGEVDNSALAWTSSDPAVVTVDDMGKLTGVSAGSATITVSSNGLEESFVITVTVPTIASETFMGSFQSMGSYTVTGTATLAMNSSGNWVISFSRDFSVSSLGAGLFIFLSDAPLQNASEPVLSSKVMNLGRIKSMRGKQEYEITQNISNPSLLKHVTVWCNPYKVTFGKAQLTKQ